jgi:hypothetical protein
MPTTHLRPIAMLAAALAVVLAACTPLPTYDTRFTLTLEPGDGSGPFVLEGAFAPQPEIFADLATAAEQKDLLMIIGNGDASEPSLGFLFWRYENDVDGWVEQAVVTIDDRSWTLDATPLGPGTPVPDAFAIEPYADPDFPGNLGRIRGAIARFTIDDASEGSIAVTLTGLDALVRASGDAPSDPAAP